MVARLERNVQGRAARPLSGCAQRLHFGMRLAATSVEPLAERVAVVNDRGADGRVRRRAAHAALCEFVCPREIDRVLGCPYGCISTPRQNAMWSLMCLASSFGSG
jgi:hypothetical protein